MPYRKKNQRAKKAPRKRYNKKKAKYNKPTTTIVRSPGFADSLYVRLKYAETVQMNSGSAHYYTYAYRGNSLFDPNYTGAGHQPMYFDQYSAIYNRYRVMGCAIKINAINVSNSAAAYLIIQSGTDTSLPTDVTQLLEQSRAHITRTIPVASRYPVAIKSYVSTRKACGLNKKQIFDEDFSALVTANPAQLWYHNIMVQSVDGLTYPNVQLMVTLTYYCQFFDRTTQNQS